MKYLTTFLSLVLVSIAFSRDFRPASHLENIPASNSSIQQCYVFETTPGVGYTVEVSNNLSDWTPQDELYGLGGEYAVAMREFTPPPPPPPGTPPANPPTLPTNVSLRLQPASGAAGGIVVAWRSLDHDGPMIVRIAAEIDVGWNQIPIFWNRFADYNFYFWHPGVAVAPPAVDSPLGPKDSAMLAVLEASVPAINQQIAASILHSRNAPPPAPPDPDSKRFWRVKVDWSLDTDQDGSPDWAEFEIAARSTGLLVPGVTGDAFNADTNNDGIPDGLQLDSDGDGTPDGIDINPSDNTATFPIGPISRYALFPITNAQPTGNKSTPFQISDKGTVLYDNGTWTAGVWTALDFPSGTGLTQTKALGINDANQIIGAGSRDITSNFGEPDEICGICYWSDPHGVRNFVSSGNGTAEKYAVATHEFYSRQLSPGPVLSNDGHFSAFTKPKADHAWIMPSPGYWKLPTGIKPATEASGDHRLEYSQVPNLRWGAGYSLGLYSTMQFSGFGGPEDESKPLERLIHAPNLLPAPPFTAINVFTPTPDLVLALPAATSAADGMAFVKGKWVASATYGKAIDISKDGTAIGKAHDNLTAPICINGKWTGIERTAPRLPLAWTGPTIMLSDTTPGGWILAERNGPDPALYQPAVLLPVRVDGVDPDLVPPALPPAPGAPPFDPPEYLAGGVDHTSMSASGGSGRVPEIWIMAPTARNKSARFQSPLNAVSSLSIPSNNSFQFTPEVITSNDQVIQIKALYDNGSFRPVLKLGGTVESLSSPVMIKVMKKRIIKVAVHPVALKQGSDDAIYPSRIPSNSEEDRNDFKQQITEYLDKVYGQQVNAFFNIGVMPSVEVDFDTVAPAGEVAVLSGNDFSPEMTIACTIPQWPSGVADIDIWILGGTILKDGQQSVLGVKIGGTYGENKESQTPYIIVDGSDSVGRTIAHEMGHIFMGGGHPDVPAQSYFARLTGISQEQRLMKQRAADHSKCQLIKKEWDKIEQWLKDNIDK